MKPFISVVIACVVLAGSACKKKHADVASTGSGSSAIVDQGMASGSAPAPAPDVSCKDAAKAYTDLMASGAGNALAELKPNEGQRAFVRVSIEEDCDRDWTPATRACVATTRSTADIAKCWSDPAGYARVDQDLQNVVAEIKAKAGAGGSGSATP